MQANQPVSLDAFSQIMRDYQEDVLYDALEFVDDALEILNTEEELALSQSRRLYACPTGTGKGSMQLALLKRLLDKGTDAWILSPALEVLRGCLERCGLPKERMVTLTADGLAELGASIRVTTPLRYSNGVLRGEWAMPEVIIYDEAHHAVEANEVSGSLFAMAPEAVWLGFTATPYRGTPKGTLALREAWGEPIVVLTTPEAVDAGYQALPTFEVVPLVDDDSIRVVNGKFQTKAAGNRVKKRLGELADLIYDRVSAGGAQLETWGLAPPLHDMPTAVIVPNTELAGRVVEELDERGVDAYMVIGSTKVKDRAIAYAACEARRSVLVAVNVLNEGVDFPWLGRVIDSKPTVSPVSWVQLVGRIMRPKPFKPEYVTTCRNLERHAYLLSGAVPRAAVVEAQQAFPQPTKRDGHRSIGFEALARFKRISFPMAGGLRGSMFNVHDISPTGVKTEWCIVTSPLSDKALVARKDSQTGVDPATGQRTYDNKAKWVSAPMPTDLAGFATSQQTGSLSPKQVLWWGREANKRGLDPLAAEKLKRREFQILPVLANLKTNILSLGDNA